MIRIVTRFTSFALLAIVPTVALGLDFIWDGDRPSDNWNAAAAALPLTTNWVFDFGIIPDLDDTVTFPDTAADFIVDLNGNREVISATFTGTQPYTLNNNTLTLNAGLITTTGSATHTINSNVAFTTDANFDTAAGSALTINGTVSGTGDLEKTGDGTLTLANPANALTGQLLLTGGIVQITEPLQTAGLDVADATTLDGHAPDMPPTGDAQPGQALTVNGNVSVAGSGLVDLSGADGLDRAGSLGDGNGQPGADAGSFDATGTSFQLTDTSSILLQGGRGGSAVEVNTGNGASGADGGTLTATVATFSLSDSAQINLNGGIGGRGGDEFGNGGDGGNGGSLNANTTTLTLTNDSQITLNGASGGSGGDLDGSGGEGGNAGSFTTSAITITLSHAAINQTGGRGGSSTAFHVGNSGDSGDFSAPAATTINLTGSARINLSGTDGRNSSSFLGAGDGGHAGTFSAPAATLITLADTARINLSGSAGGSTPSSMGGTAGKPGNAGQFNGGDGQLILSGSARILLDGGDASIASTSTPSDTGTDAGSLIGTFDLDLSGSSSLSMLGGDGRTKSAVHSGGDGGSINLTDARSMTLSDTATVNLSGGRALIANPGASSGHAGAITVDTGGSLTVQDDAILTSNGGTATDDGVLSGDGGSITLASGTVTIDGGTVQLLKGTTTGSAVPGNNGHVTITDGTFLITNGGAVETDQFNHISGDATPTINLDGVLTVHDQTLLGTTTNPLVIDGGKLITDKLSHDTDTSPTLQISDPTGGDPALTVGINNGDSTFQGTIQDAATPGSLTKTGAGTLTLSGVNTYTGGTTIQEGTLTVSGIDNLGAAASDVTVSGGSTLRALGDLTLTDRSIDIDVGSLDGRGVAGQPGNDVTVSGASVLDVDNGGLINLAGGKGVSGSATGKAGGTFAVTGGAFELRSGSELRSRGGNGTNSAPFGSHGLSGDVALAGGVSNLAGLVNLSGREGGGFRSTKPGGDVQVSGDAVANLTGTINLRGGGTGSTGNGSDGGDLDVLSGSFVFDDLAATLDFRGGSSSFGSNGSPGSVTVSGGTLTLNAGVIRGTAGAVALDPINLIGAEVNVAGGDLIASDAMTLSDGAAINLSAGTMSATTVRLVDGALNFTGGVLNVDTIEGDLTQGGGSLVIGNSPGLTNITGQYQLNEGSMQIELFTGGILPVAGVDFDQLSADTASLAGGTLELVADANYVPALGDSFDILSTSNGVSGEFDSVVGAYLGGGLGLDVFYQPNVVTIKVIDVLLGDFDVDGDVDGFDFFKWQLGESPNPLSASDLADWEANYGAAAMQSLAAVPEPASALLLVGGVIGGLLGRRKSVSTGRRGAVPGRLFHFSR